MANIDDEYILTNFGHMTQREMAEHFGVAVSTVNRHCKRLGLREGMPRPARPRSIDTSTDPDENDGTDDLTRLRELRDILYVEIQNSHGPSLVKYSKEYREVLAEIRLLEGGDDDFTNDIFDEIAISFSKHQDRMPETDL